MLCRIYAFALACASARQQDVQHKFCNIARMYAFRNIWTIADDRYETATTALNGVTTVRKPRASVMWILCSPIFGVFGVRCVLLRESRVALAVTITITQTFRVFNCPSTFAVALAFACCKTQRLMRVLWWMVM